MENYNIFLPKGYEILCSLNVQGSHYVALITPLGIATHPPTASPTLTPPNSGVIARRAPHSLNTATPWEIATAYLQEVKSRLAHEPEQYHVFLETLIAYQVSSPTAEAVSVFGFINRLVSNHEVLKFNQMMQPLGLILSEHPDLLRGFYRVAGIFELQRKQKQRAKL